MDYYTDRVVQVAQGRVQKGTVNHEDAVELDRLLVDMDRKEGGWIYVAASVVAAADTPA